MLVFSKFEMQVKSIWLLLTSEKEMFAKVYLYQSVRWKASTRGYVHYKGFGRNDQTKRLRVVQRQVKYVWKQEQPVRSVDKQSNLIYRCPLHAEREQKVKEFTNKKMTINP